MKERSWLERQIDRGINDGLELLLLDGVFEVKDKAERLCIIADEVMLGVIKSFERPNKGREK